MEIFGIAENVKKFLIDSMQTWKARAWKSPTLEEEAFSRVICLCMISLTLVIRKSTADLAKGFKVNYLLFIGELDLFMKIKDQIDSLVKELYNCLVRTLEWSLG